MDAKQSNSQENKTDAPDAPVSDVSTNPELGIKKVRTFADDLREAKEKAGVVDEPEPVKKKGGFFGLKKREKEEPIKTLGEGGAPSTVPEVPKKAKFSGLTKKIQEVKEKIDSAEQPSKGYIERELAKSGIIAEDQLEEEEVREEELVEEEVLEEDRSAPEPEPALEKESSVPIIRTLKYDAAESIDEGNMSRVTMAAAEQNRMAKDKIFSLPDESTPIGKNIAYLVLSFVLVVAGIWGGLYFYNRGNVDTSTAEQVNRGIILFTNSEKEVFVGDKSKNEITVLLEASKEIASEDFRIITEVILTEKGVLGDREVAAPQFLGKFKNVPGSLARSMKDDFLFAVRGGRNPTPIFIFKTEDFDTAFAGMLDWERTMSSDLDPAFGDSVPGLFEDVILKNKDTRILRDSAGEPSIIYAFPNTDTILITTDEDTFFEVFDRLKVSNTKRN